MNVTGIIAEYNPFHNGHRFHLAESRRLTKADFIIVVMSGNFLQRGEAACMDKFSRVRMALSEGADLVLELPVPFATASAPDFARGGVSLLNATGVTTHLSFGSESGELSALSELADFLNSEPEDYKSIFSAHLKSGLSYPSAREAALLRYASLQPDCFSIPLDTLKSILRNPNNILSLSYLRSLKETKSTIIPVTITRCGSGYHDTAFKEGFASATAIRNAILEEEMDEDFWNTLKEQLPDSAFSLIKKHLEQFPLLDNRHYSTQLFYKLLTTDRKDYAAYSGISADFAGRIAKMLCQFKDFKSFTALVKGKNDSYTAVSRGLLHILLNIHPQDCRCIPYLRILGFRKDAGKLLHEMKKKAFLPILTKPADARHLLDKSALSLFEKELESELIYHSAYQSLPDYIPYNPYKKTPVIL